MNEQLTRRIERLERQCRLLQVLLVAGVLAVLGGFAMRQDPTLDTFAVAGPHGAIRLSVEEDGPRLVLQDSEGTNRIELSVLDQVTPRLMLSDRDGQDRIKLFLMPDGSGLAYFKDVDGRNRVEVANLEFGLRGFVIFDDTGEPVWIAK